MRNKDLEKRIAYERMLATISSDAVSVGDIAQFINSSLELMGMTLDISRIYFSEYNYNLDSMDCTFEWTLPDVTASKDIWRGLTSDDIPWILDMLLKGHVANISDTSKIPEGKGKKILRELGSKAFVEVPLFVNNKLFGSIGFEECRYIREWANEDLYILKTAAQIISRTIEKAKIEEELTQHREDLLKQRTHLETIFDSVQDAIITIDTEGSVMDTNKAAEKICGMNTNSIVGKNFSECLRGCNQSTCYESIKETLHKGTSISVHKAECYYSEKGKKIIMLNCSPLLNQNGRHLGAVLVIRDITRVSRLEKELKDRYEYHNIIGQSEKIKKIFDIIESLTDLDTMVLITGETGTGKEMVARALHYGGARSNEPFVAVNCTALAETLLESELLGHIKGAFTGAIRDKVGRFELAGNGTILLDEIGDISSLMQLKLLRVLQEKEFERVGDVRVKKLKARVIATTNRDLNKRIKMGLFREDLYYRLKVMEMRLPPLRERLEDIPLLVDHFIKFFNHRYKKRIKLSDDVLKAFIGYSWPGNVRELKHSIERGFVLCNNRTIRIEHIPSEITNLNSLSHQRSRSHSTENPQKIIEALQMAEWNISRASRLLKISRWTLYRKMEKFDITKPV